MTKQSKNIPWLVVIVLACLMVILSQAHLLHDGGNTPAPPQREGLVRWVIRTLAEAWMGNLFRSEPPPAIEGQPGTEQIARPVSQQRLYRAMPTKPPEELMQAEGSACRHADGW